MNILAIETSCDETAAAVIKDGTTVLSNAIATSSLMHETWGGIVPEVAAREQVKSIIPVLIETLQSFTNDSAGRGNFGKKTSGRTGRAFVAFKPIIDKHIDAIAVTVGPGLIGSLLVGVEAAKTIAYITGKPIIPVNHVLAHMYANFIENPESIIKNQPVLFPAISLVVSGGHTELFLMRSHKDLTWLGGTIDDAAGEAFDKTARLLGFGSRGGLAIQESAEKFTPGKSSLGITLPRPMMHDNTLNFSFSGLKTAVLREVHEQKKNQFSDTVISEVAHETQEAICDVLVSKTFSAARKHSVKSILMSGGVAANLRLREKMTEAVKRENNVSLHIPPVSLCTDNAAYIGSYAYFRGKPTSWKLIEANPGLSVEDI